MQTTFVIHTISGRTLRVVADSVKLTEQSKTKRMIYEFATKEQPNNANFILADEVAAIFANEIISFDNDTPNTDNQA